jgi:uncharacterized protein YkwD
MLLVARARLAVLALSVLAVAAACLPLNGQEGYLFNETNAFRARNGLPALVEHDDLVRRAREWAQVLAARGGLSHSDLNQLGTSWTAAAENVGRSSSIEDVTARLEASPSHRANMLSPTYTHTGVGTARGKDGMVYAVQLFLAN